jgi:hypothetical protein
VAGPFVIDPPATYIPGNRLVTHMFPSKAVVHRSSLFAPRLRQRFTE